MNDELNSLFNKHLQKEYFSCITCCVTLDGEVLYHKSYGKVSNQRNEICRKDTIFDLASLTKVVTTTLILQLISNKKLTLSTSLGECLPASSDHSVLSPITIRQLLTHTTGLISWYPFYSHLPDKNMWNILNSINLLHTSQNSVLYSDLNFILLGEVLKNHYQATLSTIVSKQISKPYHLNSLSYAPSTGESIAETEFGNQIEMKMVKERHFTFNGFRDVKFPIAGEVNDGNTYYFFNGESGHAGLFSNVRDLVSLGELYVLDDDLNKGIDQHLLQESLKEQAPGRGLGWQVSEPFLFGAGHTGFTGTMLFVDPEQRLSVGILTNRLNVSYPKNLNDFRKKAIQMITSYIKKERFYA
ncbi:serine hydrolase [Halobacillus sp. A5]|uniref:serine hydrolase domain-containing protein n=1 Tax=Halobacillus sp. A5 TaxID=2880263 RepID=UPI0020A6BECD|nr:serine hydrolase domain-containing protein [Halobacillus sp. A5]MCP3027904.1 beta-lactamase family protein [Halobacillus sp. A5]